MEEVKYVEESKTWGRNIESIKCFMAIEVGESRSWEELNDVQVCCLARDDGHEARDSLGVRESDRLTRVPKCGGDTSGCGVADLGKRRKELEASVNGREI